MDSIGVLELTAQSRQISEYTFKIFEAFTADPKRKFGACLGVVDRRQGRRKR